MWSDYNQDEQRGAAVNYRFTAEAPQNLRPRREKERDKSRLRNLGDLHVSSAPCLVIYFKLLIEHVSSISTSPNTRFGAKWFRSRAVTIASRATICQRQLNPPSASR